MLKVQKTFAVLASLALVQVVAQGAYAQTKSSIGVVDRDKVIGGFSKAQKAAEDLKKAEENVRKLLEDSNKKYEEAKAAKKSQADLQALQTTLQKTIDGEYKKAQSLAQNLEKDLETEIDNAIKAEAANQKVDTVLMKGAVLLGGVDITDGVVKRLATTGSAPSAAKATK